MASGAAGEEGVLSRSARVMGEAKAQRSLRKRLVTAPPRMLYQTATMPLRLVNQGVRRLPVLGGLKMKLAGRRVSLLDGGGARLLPGGRRARRAVKKGGEKGDHPAQFCLAGSGGRCQQYLSNGKRSMLGVNIYDFALYVDELDLKAVGRRGPRTAEAVMQDMIKESGVDMTVHVRTARMLPINRVRAEYKHILQKRLVRVAPRGSADHKEGVRGLDEVMELFNPEQQVPWVQHGCMAKGTKIAFTRAGGALTARINGKVLGSVQSEALGRAMVDLYIGSQPVNARAKREAGDAAWGMITGRPRSLLAGVGAAAGLQAGAGGRGAEEQQGSRGAGVRGLQMFLQGLAGRELENSFQECPGSTPGAARAPRFSRKGLDMAWASRWRRGLAPGSSK